MTSIVPAPKIEIDMPINIKLQKPFTPILCTGIRGSDYTILLDNIKNLLPVPICRYAQLLVDRAKIVEIADASQHMKEFVRFLISEIHSHLRLISMLNGSEN
jgi:hypothetical protein